ncbi:MAG: YchE family NAAT transporter [Buchnera aphidicola (Periphyllus lyropictus)]|uniref:YchE family NAAT transporter n=1 Tax=Buchnera aphidicola TaxID=9 RepID=UPI001ECB79F8|nr:YchE family NAAT transporter [Buchnera aphidicola]NIH16612.1 YchE family NAAT transporter [Buchnera aphidicola (Periphyllus lyropictus)]USS94524.1 YchE family NAAT transporter [Buchnera aphidicola (Periphyllus lyropictus)]
METLSIDFKIYIKFFINLLILVNPIGMIPIFISMTNNFSEIKKKKINLITNFSSIIILCTSLFFGHLILDLFGISIASFKISGGILIFIMALSMLKKNTLKIKKKKYNSTNIGVVPLSMPLIAGPGTISSTITWSLHHSSYLNMILGTVVISFFFLFCYIIFSLSNFFINFLGNTGIKIITKIMGLLLLSLGVEFVIHGIKDLS